MHKLTLTCISTEVCWFHLPIQTFTMYHLIYPYYHYNCLNSVEFWFNLPGCLKWECLALDFCTARKYLIFCIQGSLPACLFLQKLTWSRPLHMTRLLFPKGCAMTVIDASHENLLKINVLLPHQASCTCSQLLQQCLHVHLWRLLLPLSPCHTPSFPPTLLWLPGGGMEMVCGMRPCRSNLSHGSYSHGRYRPGIRIGLMGKSRIQEGEDLKWHQLRSVVLNFFFYLEGLSVSLLHLYLSLIFK